MIDEFEQKRPDYFIQWRTSLWTSMREKESNVWKFTTFYASAMALILGLAKEYTDALTAATITTVAGLLSYWGQAIIIDSNFWWARNLKLIGNIEKLFLRDSEYGVVIPGFYSSPRYQYLRPFRIHFGGLLIIAVGSYGVFIVRLPPTTVESYWYLLPLATVAYFVGFELIQSMEKHTRAEYLTFAKYARGTQLSIGADKLPEEYWDFVLASWPKFYLWSSIAEAAVIVAYGINIWVRFGNPLTLRVVYAVVILEVVLLILCKAYHLALGRVEKSLKGKVIDWAALQREKFGPKISLGFARRCYECVLKIFRVLKTVALVLIMLAPH